MEEKGPRGADIYFNESPIFHNNKIQVAFSKKKAKKKNEAKKDEWFSDYLCIISSNIISIGLIRYFCVGVVTSVFWESVSSDFESWGSTDSFFLYFWIRLKHSIRIDHDCYIFDRLHGSFLSFYWNRKIALRSSRLLISFSASFSFPGSTCSWPPKTTAPPAVEELTN